MSSKYLSFLNTNKVPNFIKYFDKAIYGSHSKKQISKV